jgi:hypothetical protein
MRRGPHDRVRPRRPAFLRLHVHPYGISWAYSQRYRDGESDEGRLDPPILAVQQRRGPTIGVDLQGIRVCPKAPAYGFAQYAPNVLLGTSSLLGARGCSSLTGSKRQYYAQRFLAVHLVQSS